MELIPLSLGPSDNSVSCRHIMCNMMCHARQGIDTGVACSGCPYNRHSITDASAELKEIIKKWS